MGTGRRGELFAYSAIIAVNLLVLPNWFSPGRFAFGMRLAFIAASAAVIAFCAWRISGILGVNPFSKVKHPRFAPYEPDPEDDEDDRPDRESFGDDQSPFGRARRRRQEQARCRRPAAGTAGAAGRAGPRRAAGHLGTAGPAAWVSGPGGGARGAVR